ncbi:MAG: acetylxylan esterase [Clostridia bacterium]|nr:acetylxylan esterase [Clostridia bacterium]
MEMNKNPQIIHHAILKGMTPAMRWDGKQPIADWQKAARAHLAKLVGLDKIVPAADPCFTVESETDCETYTDYRILFQSEENYFVPCHLWVPKGKEGKIPMVICLQGHSKGFHISMGKPIYPGDEVTISGGDRDFAVQIVKEGYCALAIEQRCFGECGGTEKGPGCQVPTMSALLFGRTTVGERVFDISRAIDLIPQHFACVDADKIACMGNSGGGTATIYASALEERIKVSMPSCALCTYKDSIGAMSHCTCNFVPNIAIDFDMGDLCGLIAPRKLVAVSGAEDKIFPHDGVAECIDVAGVYYKELGMADGYAWVEGPEGHRFYAAQSWPIFHKFFD